jgi:hypothetical protein
MTNKTSHVLKLPVLQVVIRVFVGIIVVFILFAGCIATYFFIWQFTNIRDEKIIDKKFHDEVSTLPQIKVDQFMLWEGDSHAEITIGGKGKASFWYGKDGIPSIESVGSYSTSYECDFFDSMGQKTGYAFNTSLILSPNSPFLKWFPFQVNNLQELITHYDDIINIVSTFPNYPNTSLRDDSKEKSDIFVSNQDFTFKQLFRGKQVQCNLYKLSEVKF